MQLQNTKAFTLNVGEMIQDPLGDSPVVPSGDGIKDMPGQVVKEPNADSLPTDTQHNVTTNSFQEVFEFGLTEGHENASTEQGKIISFTLEPSSETQIPAPPNDDPSLGFGPQKNEIVDLTQAELIPIELEAKTPEIPSTPFQSSMTTIVTYQQSRVDLPVSSESETADALPMSDGNVLEAETADAVRLPAHQSYHWVQGKTPPSIPNNIDASNSLTMESDPLPLSIPTKSADAASLYSLPAGALEMAPKTGQTLPQNSTGIPTLPTTEMPLSTSMLAANPETFSEDNPAVNLAQTSGEKFKNALTANVPVDMKSTPALAQTGQILATDTTEPEHKIANAPTVTTSSASASMTADPQLENIPVDDTTVSRENRAADLRKTPETAQNNTISGDAPEATTREPMQTLNLASSTIGIEDGGDLSPFFSQTDSVPKETAGSTATALYRSPEIPARVAAQIAEAVRQLPDKPIEIALSPEELGKVRLTFQISENGAMQVVIAAERPETLDLMRRNIDTLAAELKDLGLEDSGFSFQSFDQNGAEGDPSNSEQEFSGESAEYESASAPDVTAASTITKIDLSGTSGVDIRL